jgi:hypothetical protein
MATATPSRNAPPVPPPSASGGLRRESDGRLVPIGLVSSAGPEIELSCNLPEFETIEQAQELRFLPGARGQWGCQQQDMLSWPHYGTSST